jgi:D-amino-acid dehydrogenase
MSARNTDVLIVGGGVIGLACAHYLQGQGRTVRILDQGRVGGGSSHGNCGLITPSHVPPLAVPGMWGKALRWMLDPGSPFYMKPTLRPSVLGWFLRFAARCNARDAARAAAGRSALLDSSRSQYDALVAEHGLRCEWQPRGLLMVYRSESGMRHAESLAQLEAACGVNASSHSGKDLRDLEPALRDDVAGARFYAMDGHLRPDLLVGEMLRIVRDGGAAVEEDCAVQRFEGNGRGEVRLRTARGDFRAGAAVLAAGAWTPLLARRMGVTVPIQPGKGYTMTMPRPAVCPTYPLLLKERSIAVTPWSGLYRLGGTMEFSGYSEGVNRRRMNAIVKGAGEYLKEPVSSGEREEWFGWRPMTYDDLPFIGRAPGRENVWVAAGHGMMGVSMAPATGRLVSELVTGTEPHVDPAPYRLERA